MILDTLKAKLAGLHKSWTAWFNGLTAFVAFGLPQAADQLPTLHDFIPQHLYGWALGATVLGNLVLRFKTSLPLEQK